MIETFLLALGQLDEKTFLWLQDLFPGHYWLIVANILFASQGLFIILLIYLLLWFLGRNSQEKRQNRIGLTAALALALLARFGFKEIITVFWSRPRPFEALNTISFISHDPGGSFPSGHATFLFALAAAIWMHDRRMGIFFTIMAFSASASRVIVGIHWTGDILGGIILGVATSVIFYRPAKKYIERFL